MNWIIYIVALGVSVVVARASEEKEAPIEKRLSELYIAEVLKIEQGVNGFPLIQARVRNASKKELKLVKHPNYVVCHVGKFTNSGPIVSYAGKGFTLGPGKSYITTNKDYKVWIDLKTLKDPRQLAQGEYRVWVEFKVGKKWLKSERLKYVVK